MSQKQHLQTPAPQVTARSIAETPEPPSCSSLMQGLNQSISQHQDRLIEFQRVVEQSLNASLEVKCKCKRVLAGSVKQLKGQFGEFANEWKNQLPLICKEFMEIVGKICHLYQQELQRLVETNSKWQFSYQQLLRATNSANSSFLSLTSKIDSEYSKKGQPCSTQPLGHRFEDMAKPKDYEISLMREQITELFEEESSFYEKELTNEIKNLRVNNKAVTESEKIIEDIREFRLKTANDQQVINGPLHGNCKSNSNFSSKSSQQNSRKNSVAFRQQFWMNLNNGKASRPSQPGKENINILSKERLSIPHPNVSKQETKAKLNQSTGCSKLQQLKKNLYKSKNPTQPRA